MNKEHSKWVSLEHSRVCRNSTFNLSIGFLPLVEITPDLFKKRWGEPLRPPRPILTLANRSLARVRVHSTHSPLEILRTRKLRFPFAIIGRGLRPHWKGVVESSKGAKLRLRYDQHDKPDTWVTKDLLMGDHCPLIFFIIPIISSFLH